MLNKHLAKRVLRFGAGEMAQELRTFVIFADAWIQFPASHTEAHS